MINRKTIGPFKENTIIIGDCLDIMPQMPDGCVDLVVTDPPYGITRCDWDKIPDLERMWIELKRIGKDNCAYIFTASQPFTTDLINSNRKWFKYEWIWEKSHPSGIALVNKRVMKYHENILVFYKKQPIYNPQKRKGQKSHSVGKQLGKRTKSKSNPNMIQTTTVYSDIKHPKDIIYIPNPRLKGQHPTQKPIALMEYLIKTYSNKGDLVADFFIGSGTTAIAADRLGRKFFGCDINPDCVETALKRLKKDKIER